MDKETDIEKEFLKIQKELCVKYNAGFVETPFNKFIGISLKSFNIGNMPINGLRHPDQSEQTVNWYIWSGEYSNTNDFFQPVHVRHLLDICPKALRFLGLEPGWRFLFDNEYEDVWYDEQLLR